MKPTTTNNMEDYVTVKEACIDYKISRSWLFFLMKKGSLTRYKRGSQTFILKSEVQNLVHSSPQ